MSVRGVAGAWPPKESIMISMKGSSKTVKAAILILSLASVSALVIGLRFESMFAIGLSSLFAVVLSFISVKRRDKGRLKEGAEI